jgi:2-dehydro-3-deoxyglucarate aldolase
LFGAHFDAYVLEAQAPLLVAMIEHQRAVHALPAIVGLEGIDAVLIGPYDLSASLGRTADFLHPEFESLIARILEVTSGAGIACGVHVVALSPQELQRRRAAGFRFLAYGIDSVILQRGAVRPPSP